MDETKQGDPVSLTGRAAIYRKLGRCPPRAASLPDTGKLWLGFCGSLRVVDKSGGDSGGQPLAHS